MIWNKLTTDELDGVCLFEWVGVGGKLGNYFKLFSKICKNSKPQAYVGAYSSLQILSNIHINFIGHSMLLFFLLKIFELFKLLLNEFFSVAFHSPGYHIPLRYFFIVAATGVQPPVILSD